MRSPVRECGSDWRLPWEGWERREAGPDEAWVSLGKRPRHSKPSAACGATAKRAEQSAGRAVAAANMSEDSIKVTMNQVRLLKRSFE
jgi:hypothetical protein